MMLAVNIAVYLSLALAIWSAGRGCVAAIGLVSTNLLARLVSLVGWPLSISQMLFLDVLVIAAIIIAAVKRRYMMNREVLICALFIPAWRFYILPVGYESAAMVQFYVLSGVVLAQLLLTLPWRTIFYKLRLTLGKPVGRTPHRLERVAHA